MRKSVLLILLSIVLIASLVALAVREHRLAIRWDHARDNLALEETAWEAQDFARPTLLPALARTVREDANAWPHWQRAIELTRTLRSGWEEAHEGEVLTAHLRRRPRPAFDLEQPGVRAILAAVDAGARCGIARPTVRWAGGWAERPMVPLLDTRTLEALFTYAAEEAVLGGRSLEAVALLYQSLGLARDLAESSSTLIDEMVGCVLLQDVCRNLCRSEILLRMDHDALVDLAGGLAILDASFAPVGRGPRAEFLLVRHALLEPPDSAGRPSRDRTELLAWVNRYRAHLGVMERVAARPWPEVLAAFAPEDGRAASPEDDDWAKSRPAYESVLSTRRMTHALVRMARMVLAARRGIAVDALPNPFGGDLLWERTADGIRIWAPVPGRPGSWDATAAKLEAPVRWLERSREGR